MSAGKGACTELCDTHSTGSALRRSARQPGRSTQDPGFLGSNRTVSGMEHFCGTCVHCVRWGTPLPLSRHQFHGTLHL